MIEQHGSSMPRRLLLATIASCAVLFAILAGNAASAQAAAPWWRLEAVPAPTILQPGQEGQIVLSALDAGDEEIDATGSPITITNTLPKGLKVITWTGTGPCEVVKATEACLKTAYSAKETPCITSPETATTGETVTCTFKERLTTFEVLQVFIPVEVEASTGSLTDAMSVSGGERSVVGGPAPDAS